MAQNSNISDVRRWLDQWVKGIDFTRPGKDQSLGRDIAIVIIRGRPGKLLGGIQGRASREHRGASPTPWPPNSSKPSRWHPGGYKGWKAERYGLADEPNFRSGQMLSQTSLYGQTTIQPTVVTMRYGTGTPPSRSAAPTGYLSDADRRVTDTAKAQYNSPKRPFYEIDSEDAKAVVEECQEFVNRYIIMSNSGR